MAWIERQSSSLVSGSATCSYWASVLLPTRRSSSSAPRSVSSMTAPMLPGRGLTTVCVDIGAFLRRIAPARFLRSDDFPAEHLDHPLHHVRCRGFLGDGDFRFG